MAGYTRQATANIATGSVIDADDFNDEYNQIQSAFNASTGHTHDGTAAEGAPIEKIGPSQDVVATASVLRPKTTNTVDLGTTALQYKDAFFDGTVKTDTLTVDENATITGNLTVNGTLSSAGGGVMSNFILEDGDGTEVTIDDGKEVKFVEGDGIDVNWTDVSTGSDADPYDLTFSLKTDRRSSSNTDIYTGNSSDYIFFDASHGMRFYTAGAEDMRLEDDGDLHVDGNITAYSTTVSDQRLKHDIEKIDSALDKVSQLSGYTFSYNKDGKRSAGVIAQEVEKVLPSAVESKSLAFHGEENIEYKTVQYDQLHGLLIEAIKELKEKLDECKCKKCECE